MDSTIPTRHRKQSLFVQWAVLLSRNTEVFLADRPNLFMASVLTPLIALCACLTFIHVERDDAEANEAARRVYYLRLKAQPQMDANEPLGLDLADSVMDAAEREKWLISEVSAQRRATVYFVLASAAIWLGIMGACKEIVNEKAVLYRETHAGVGLLPYLLAKFTMQVVIIGLQTALLCGIVWMFLLRHSVPAPLQLWLWLWLTAAAAASLGLLVSACSPTLRMALTMVPLLMMMQLMLGGLLRPPSTAADQNRLREAFGSLTIQRWAFEAALTTDIYATGGVLTVRSSPRGTLDERYGAVKMVSADQGTLVSRYFRERSPNHLRIVPEYLVRGHVLLPMAVIVLMTIVALTSSYIILRAQFL